jgi:M6 family metalloprotease-like protein
MNAAKPTDDQLYNMMFDKNTFGTVANFYDAVTNKVAQVVPAETNTAKKGIVFVELPGPHGDWGNNYSNMVSDLIIPAIRRASGDGSIDYSNFDANHDGLISSDELSIGVIVHGYETGIGLGNANGYPDYPAIQAHAWEFSPETINGVNISKYFTAGAFHNKNTPPQLLTIGTFVHELGHSAFDFIDLYDVDKVGVGVGNWSVMGSGCWGFRFGEPQGTTPTGLDAYHISGGGGGIEFSDSQNMTMGNNTISGLTAYAKLPTSDPNQYFLIQPRGNVGYDRGFWRTSWYPTNAGLLIYLVDDNLTGGNSLSKNSQYREAIVEADWNAPTALYDVSDKGTPTDLFSANTNQTFSDSTTPSSKIYKDATFAYPTISTNLDINNIAESITGDGMENGLVSLSFYYGSGAAPVITGHPQNQTSNAGDTVTFSVTATGSGPLRYYWMRSDDYGQRWSSIPGANNATYSFTAQLSNQAVYFCVTVENEYGRVSSNEARLFVLDPDAVPKITGHPQSLEISDGNTARFNVTATGTNLMSYQWQRSDDGGSTWSDIQNWSANSYWLYNVQIADSGARFRVIVSNEHGSVTSNEAQLTVSGAPPSIRVQPINQLVEIGNSASFSVNARSTAPLSYKWQISEDSLAWSDIPDADMDTYSLIAKETDRGVVKYFRAVVTNDYGSVTSNYAWFAVILGSGGGGGGGGDSGTPPEVYFHPTNVAVKEGHIAYFDVRAEGTKELRYQWQKSNDDGNHWLDLAPERWLGTPQYTLNSDHCPIQVLKEDHNALVRVVVSNKYGSDISKPAMVTILPNIDPPYIMAMIRYERKAIDMRANYKVWAAGAAPLNYQWQISDIIGNKEWRDIPDATSNFYSFIVKESDKAHVFRVLVSNEYGTTTSPIATITVSSKVNDYWTMGTRSGGCNTGAGWTIALMTAVCAIIKCRRRRCR